MSQPKEQLIKMMSYASSNAEVFEAEWTLEAFLTANGLSAQSIIPPNKEKDAKAKCAFIPVSFLDGTKVAGQGMGLFVSEKTTKAIFTDGVAPSLSKLKVGLFTHKESNEKRLTVFAPGSSKGIALVS